MGYTFYRQDNNGWCMRAYDGAEGGAWPTRYATYKYIGSGCLFCPSSVSPKKQNASNDIGIGLNYGTFGIDETMLRINETQIAVTGRDSTLIVFMDTPTNNEGSNCNGYQFSRSQGFIDDNKEAYYAISTRHDQSANAGFFDGHAENVKRQDAHISVWPGLDSYFNPTQNGGKLMIREF